MSPVDVLLVGEPQAMARLRRSLRGGEPALRVTVARDPKSIETGLRSKRIAVAVVQQPPGGEGEVSPAGRIRERWPGCAVLGWVESGRTPPQAEAARDAGLDGLLFEDGSTPEALRLQLHLAADRAAERAEALEARARYRSLFDHVPVGLYRTSPRGDILEANAELARMLRYPDSDALRALKASGLYARRRDRKRILDGQRDESVLHAPAMELRRSDGESLWVEDHARPLRDAAGEIIAYEGSLLDVTERRRLEIELRASEERFRSLVQNATDVIAVVSERGEIEYISPSSKTQFGYRPDELIGRIAFDLIHPEDLARVGQAYGEVLQRSNPGTPTEFRFLHAAGHWIEVETVASNLLDQPAVAGIVMTTRVVTERKQAEAELQESRRRLSTLLGNLPGMAYRCRNDPQWTMELVSEGCLELTGFPAVDLQANRVVSYASLIHPKDRELVWQAVQAAVEDGRRFQLSYRILTAEGGERWVWEQGGAVAADADGTLMLEGFIADITDRRAAEDELRTSRAWLQHIVEAVDDVLVVYDAEGRYVDVITGDDSLLMRPVSDMLGRTVAEVLPAEIAQRFLTGIRIVVTQGASYEFEYPLDLPRGVRWFRARGRRIRESDSGGPLTLWSITDTTERKETEQALLRQGRQLELLSRISQQLNTVLEIPAVLRTLVASGMDLVDASAGTAGVWTGEVMRFSEYNRDGLLEPIDLALAPGMGVPGVVAQTRSSYLANHPHADALLASAGKDLGIRNLINVPIISREGALLGCLEVHNRRRGEPFNESDVSILEGLASNAAVALENAQLLAERLHAEEELRQVKEFNEDIVLSMGEGILVQDRLGAFTFVNPAAAAMLGYTPEELLQAPWTRIVPPDQHAIVSAVDADRERGRSSRYEIEFVRRDGTRLPALVSGSPRFRDGRFDGMLAVFADLSERAAAEVALRESEQQFRSVAERSPSMIFINQAGRIVYVNARCSEVMGYRPEQLLAPEFRFESLVAPESLPIVRQAFASHARGEDVEPYEYDL
ncbi:MAG: PAS domain S-box protein, partial [Chloroflexi bacterium]|nr:PAS domain S-box protein [Chloroflexota bacterium]